MSSLVVDRAAAPQRRGAVSWWPVGLVVAAGLVVGVGTQAMQGVLPEGWGVLANSGVMWALCAFALGAVLPTPTWSAVGGAAQLVIASIVYYAAVDWFEAGGSGDRAAVVWSVAGVVVGSLFGLAGHSFVHRAGWRDPALALVSGVLVGEGIHLTRFVGNRDLRAAGLVELVIAAAIAAVCLVRASRSRSGEAVATVVGVVVGSAAITLVAMRIIDGVFLVW